MGFACMSFAWALWEITVNGIETLLFCYLLSKKLGRNDAHPRRVWLGLAGLTAILSFLNYIELNYILVMFIMLFLDLSYALLAFGGNIGQRLLWGASSTAVAIFSSTLVLTIFGREMSATFDNAMSETWTRFVLMVAYILVEAVIYVLLAQRAKTDLHLPLSLRILFVLLLVLGALAAGLLIKITFIMAGFQSPVLLAAAVSGIFLMVLLGMLILFESHGIVCQKNIDLEVGLQQERMEKVYHQQAAESYQAMRTWKHDFNNHMTVLESHAENQDFDALHDYIEQMRRGMDHLLHFVSTGNPTIDAVVSNKMTYASAHNIPFNSVIVMPQKLPISDVDMCALLGNLLDNAVEASLNLKNSETTLPYIDFRLEQKQGMLFIQTTNCADGVYNYKNNNLASKKTEGDHGLGFKRIQQIVKKTGGFIQAVPEPDRFTVSILLPLPQNM
jgi:hypothetical protein